MNYEKNYITLTQYKQRKMAGSRYTGFVIGYGLCVSVVQNINATQSP